MNTLKTALALMLVALSLAPGISMSLDNATEVIPGSRAAGLDACVAPTEYMRRNHMEELLHKRNQTMRQGIRTEEFSMNECVSCHAAKDDSGHYVPVTDKGQFCQSCHERVSQQLDCFECHRTTPES